MVMVQQPNQLHSSNDTSNQNGASSKRGGGDEVWPPLNSSLRVKKPMLSGRKLLGGPCTPVPRWKLYENPFYDGIAAAAAAAAAQQQQQQQHNSTKGGRGIAVSARKLAATLWELQEFPFSLAAAAASSKSPACPCLQHRSSSSSSSSKKSRNHPLALANSNNTSNHGSPSPPHPDFFHTHNTQQATVGKESMISLQHPNKAWESVKKSSESQSTSNRQNAALRSHVHRLFKERADARLNQLAQPKAGSYVIRDIQEHHAAQSSVVAALRVELERVRARAHELELAHKKARREIDNLLKKLTEEKLSLRNREQEKIRSAVQAVKVEAEEEKKARRRIESVNRKMSRELVDANITIAQAIQELEKEKKARELMEDVCNELAREIGEDKQEVEELKRESAKVREEVEEERKMLQMAEVWREERVQMKLAEARLDIEEKTMLLDNLRAEVVAFLNSRKAFLQNAEDDEVSCKEVVQEAESLKAAIDALQIRDVVLPDSYRPPNTDEEASDHRGEQRLANSVCPQPDKREGWGWGAQTSSNYGESVRLATKDEVLERLRRKWEQTDQQSKKGAREGDGSRQWEDERGNASEWNSQSEHLGGDPKEEEGSQWESASDQDILEAMEPGNSNESSQSGRVGGVERQNESQADAAVHSTPYDRNPSPQNSSTKPAAELSSGDDFWRTYIPVAGAAKVLTEEQGRRSSGEGCRSFHARGMSELSRGAHARSVPEQGIASPSRDWRSPDRGNPHIAMGIKGFIEWPKMYRENGVKNKVFEPKIEKIDRQMLKQSS
ncbi:unnamed protein product [Calypogeia fissa]